MTKPFFSVIAPAIKKELYMAFYEYGLKIVICEDSFVISKPGRRKKYPYNDELLYYCGPSDTKLVNSWWRKEDNTFSKNRLSEVESFADEDILTKSQGPKKI